MQQGAGTGSAATDSVVTTNSSRNTEILATHIYEGRYIRYEIFGCLFDITSKYRPPIMQIGVGSCGQVCSALDSEKNEMVAIKKIPNAFDNLTNAKRTLREIKLLRRLDHENVIGIRDVIPPPVRSEFYDVYIATELMEIDLHRIIHSDQELSENHRQYFLYQILRGLKYIHSANVIHRDLKPSNLLLNSACDLKICDFGLARLSLENEFMTEYVVTRWYRAPEVLLFSSDYSASIDVWSVGCIFMEMVNRKILFPGKDHTHQMHLITQLLGTPNESDLAFIPNEEARKFILRLGFHPRMPLAVKFPDVDPDAMDLVAKMLTFDPTRRITVMEALAHPYLAMLHDINDEPVCSEPFNFEFERHSLLEEQYKELIFAESLKFNPGHIII